MFKTILTAILAIAAFAAQAQTAAPVISNAAPTSTPYCLYGDQRYSEGAIYRAAGVTLVCVAPDWGNKFESTRADLVWEPTVSKRLKALREISQFDAPRKQ